MKNTINLKVPTCCLHSSSNLSWKCRESEGHFLPLLPPSTGQTRNPQNLKDSPFCILGHLILGMVEARRSKDGRKKRHLRIDLLVVSLISSLDFEVAIGSKFFCMFLFSVGGLWVCFALLRGWRKGVGIRRERLDRKKRGEFSAAPFFPSKTAGIILPEKRESMVLKSLNMGFSSENCMCWLSRLSSLALSRNSSEGGIDCSKQNFPFPAGQGGKILLVEDTEINRVLLRKLIKGLNLLLEEAENGQIAVDYFKQGKNYDLVFMDKEMPVMDGHEATRQLRSLGVKTPIVALTGNSLPSDKDLFFQAGADEFRTKPLSRDSLVQLLARYGLNNTSE